MTYYIGKDADKIALSHYGVLGMKWSIRRYQNEDGSLTEAGKKRYGDSSPGHVYKSWATKHNEKKAEKARSKGYEVRAKEYDRRANRSRELDRREEQYSKSVKAGANIALRILSSGTIGGKRYQKYLAMINGTDEGTNGPTLKKAAAFVGSYMTLGISPIIKAIYLRSGVKDS